MVALVVSNCNQDSLFDQPTANVALESQSSTSRDVLCREREDYSCFLIAAALFVTRLARRLISSMELGRKPRSRWYGKWQVNTLLPPIPTVKIAEIFSNARPQKMDFLWALSKQ